MHYLCDWGRLIKRAGRWEKFAAPLWRLRAALRLLVEQHTRTQRIGGSGVDRSDAERNDTVEGGRIALRVVGSRRVAYWLSPVK